MIGRAATVYREQGWRGVWFGVLARTGVYRRLDLIALELANPPPLVPCPPDLDIGFISPADAADLARLGGPWSPAQAEERFQRGERCYAARDGTGVVAARWLALDRAHIPYLDRWITVAPGAIYHYESYTRPDRRGLGIAPALGTRLAAALAGEGLHRIIAVVLPENRNAVRAAEKVGYRRAGRIGYVKLGAWRRELSRHDAPAS